MANGTVKQIGSTSLGSQFWCSQGINALLVSRPFQNATSASFGTPADSPVVLHRVISSVEAGTEPYFNRPACAEQAQTSVQHGIQADWSAIWK